MDETLEDSVCDSQTFWQIEPREIVGIRLVNAPEPRMGVTERLLVDVRLHSSCERLGKVDVNIAPGDATDFVGLAAYAWALYGEPCEPDAPVVTWVVTISGRHHGNIGVGVRDENNPDAGEFLYYGRELCPGWPDCQCWLGAPPGPGAEGSECITDCSCGQGLSCIGYWGYAGPLWSCSRSCADFLDCNITESCAVYIADGPPYACRWQGDQCEPAGNDCPDGFSCAESEHGNFCADQREYPSSIPCRCDAECPTGQLCISSGISPAPTCEIPCLRSADCPNPEVDIFICGTPAICVPLV